MKPNATHNVLFAPSLKIVAAVALAGFLSLPGAMGQTFYESGFEVSQNYTTNGGSQGTGNLSGQGGDGSMPNWSTGGSSQLLIVTSSSGSTTLLPPEGNQMLQAQYGTGSTTGQQNFLTATNAIKESFNFSFQLAVNADSVGNAAFSMYVSGQQDANGLYIGLQRDGAGTEGNPYVYGFIARQSEPGGGSYYTRLGTDTFSLLNEFHTFNLTLDWDTLTFGGTVSNSGGLVTTFSNVAIWDRDGTVHTNGFSRVGFQINQVGNSPYFLIDDIHISAIPEPSALALALLGIATIFHRRRRKS